MKQEEIRKCTKVVELFRSMMDELGDMCVVYDVSRMYGCVMFPNICCEKFLKFIPKGSN